MNDTVNFPVAGSWRTFYKDKKTGKVFGEKLWMIINPNTSFELERPESLTEDFNPILVVERMR
jgi:hypothetical protein